MDRHISSARIQKHHKHDSTNIRNTTTESRNEGFAEHGPCVDCLVDSRKNMDMPIAVAGQTEKRKPENQLTGEGR